MLPHRIPDQFKDITTEIELPCDGRSYITKSRMLCSQILKWSFASNTYRSGLAPIDSNAQQPLARSAIITFLNVDSALQSTRPDMHRHTILDSWRRICPNLIATITPDSRSCLFRVCSSIDLVPFFPCALYIEASRYQYHG